MNNSLPLLKEMIIPTFFTISKGVKIKKEGINMEKEFKNVAIDEESLQRYKQFFDWQSSHPLPFFYLMAQRAQTSLMLQPEFSIAIPGLVHASNRMEMLATVDYNLPFDLKVHVSIDYKEVGSLIPKFTVSFIQNNQEVIRCESTYIAKRKGNKKTSSSDLSETFITTPFSSDIWEIPQDLGKQYGKASGDKNPIHTSVLFAKIIGFPRTILHGWYSVSKIVNDYEIANDITFRYIEVDFKSPIFLPSKQKVEIQKNENEVLYQITDVTTNKIVLNGKLR